MSLLAKVNPQFVNIQGGTFKMGSMTWDDTQPIKQVTLSPFQMMDAPVTVAQFKAFIEWGEQRRFGQFIYGPDGHIVQTIWGSSAKALQKKTIAQKAGQFTGDIRRLVPTMQEYERRFFDDIVEDGARHYLGDNKPVVSVDWYEAAAFCFAIGWRLPTEAEHEYASLAGRKGEDDVSDTDLRELNTEIMQNRRWDHDGSVHSTADIRSYEPNLWKLYDMAGLVREWCSNWSSLNYEGWAVKDPAGSLVGSARALRGGSWYDEDRVLLNAAVRDGLLSAERDYGRPDDLSSFIGFRGVRPQGSRS